MSLQLTEERAAKVNEWIKIVESISSETISLFKKDDPFTKWDREYYSTTKFVDGRVDRCMVSRDTPSSRLHRINNILEGWGLKFSTQSGWNDGKFSYSGILYITVEINTFHTDLFKINNGDWLTYHDRLIEVWIDDVIIEISNKTSNVSLNRLVKIKSIVKND